LERKVPKEKCLLSFGYKKTLPLGNSFALARDTLSFWDKDFEINFVKKMKLFEANFSLQVFHF
jgi:hypothetical protein